MSALRLATAPISWGVSEVEGWGHQMAPERVLTEMRGLGFEATELGAEGFLPPAPEDKAALLRRHGLRAIGSFVPVLAHDPGVDPLPRVRQELRDYAASGAEVLVIAAVTGQRGYEDQRSPLSAQEWEVLLGNLERIRELAAAAGAVAVLHPHVGTVIETEEDVDHVLTGSTIPFCFDTGHLMLGGVDPVGFARDHADRIAALHLKDVSLAGMRRIRAGELSYEEAIAQDVLYRPVGDGDVDIRAILQAMHEADFEGWIVLEQDKVVPAEPPPGEGPVRDAARSLRYVRSVLAELDGSAGDRGGR